MDEIHVHKTKKSICAHFAESPCTYLAMLKDEVFSWVKKLWEIVV